MNEENKEVTEEVYYVNIVSMKMFKKEIAKCSRDNNDILTSVNKKSSAEIIELEMSNDSLK